MITKINDLSCRLQKHLANSLPGANPRNRLYCDSKARELMQESTTLMVELAQYIKQERQKTAMECLEIVGDDPFGLAKEIRQKFKLEG